MKLLHIQQFMNKYMYIFTNTLRSNGEKLGLYAFSIVTFLLMTEYDTQQRLRREYSNILLSGIEKNDLTRKKL